MGYESRVYIIRRSEIEKTDHTEPWVWGEVIARYDLSKMGDALEFFGAFRKEIDYTLYLPYCDEYGDERVVETQMDCYGEHMKSANINEVITALENIEARDHYRRLPPLIAMLKAFAAEQDEWNSKLEVVHYGH